VTDQLRNSLLQLGIDRRAVRAAKTLAGRVGRGEIGWAPQLRELIAFARIAEVLGPEAAAGNLVGMSPGVKPVVELLAGIPSVVLGFLALLVLATWLQDLFGFDYRLNAITAGIAMALAIIPIIYTVSEDALTSVPRTYREASLALGVAPWKTAWSVVLPAATPGIFAALILGFGRAMGETMVLCGNAAPRPSREANTLRLKLSGRDANIALKVEDIGRRMVANIPDVLTDLLEVATYVYCADQLIARGSLETEPLRFG
jgi:hypothetical protein